MHSASCDAVLRHARPGVWRGLHACSRDCYISVATVNEQRLSMFAAGMMCIGWDMFAHHSEVARIATCPILIQRSSMLIDVARAQTMLLSLHTLAQTLALKPEGKCIRKSM